MIEILEDFKGTILKMLNNQETTFEEKLENFANSYYESIVTNPKVFLNLSTKNNVIAKNKANESPMAECCRAIYRLCIRKNVFAKNGTISKKSPKCCR